MHTLEIFEIFWSLDSAVEYLGKIKTEFENILACLSGAYTVDGFESWKKWRSKILLHTPFNLQNIGDYFWQIGSKLKEQ